MARTRAPHIPAAEADGPIAAGSSASDPGASFDPGAASVVIEDAVVMVLGPAGDPIPPGAFCAAVARQPQALVHLQDDTVVPAARIALVLRAQAIAPLVPPEREGRAWLAAMLGLGPQPMPTGAAELHAEEEDVPHPAEAAAYA